MLIVIGYRNLVIITIFPYHWRLLDFSKGHLKVYSFLWLFGRVEPLFNSIGSPPPPTLVLEYLLGVEGRV